MTGTWAIRKHATWLPSSVVYSGRPSSSCTDDPIAVRQTKAMAQADLLVSLFRSGAAETSSDFMRTAQALIEEERLKGHRILANRLIKSLESSPVKKSPSMHPNSNVNHPLNRDLVFEIAPERTLESLVLADRVRDHLKEFVEEQHRADLLHSHNLRARNRAHCLPPMRRIVLASTYSGASLASRPLSRSTVLPICPVADIGKSCSTLMNTRRPSAGSRSMMTPRYFRLNARTCCYATMDSMYAKRHTSMRSWHPMRTSAPRSPCAR